MKSSIRILNNRDDGIDLKNLEKALKEEGKEICSECVGSGEVIIASIAGYPQRDVCKKCGGFGVVIWKEKKQC